MHIYVFGSVCRGDITRDSDIDLLALVNGRNEDIDPESFSIYSYSRIKTLFASGAPFAWHLHRESKCVFSADGRDFIQNLNAPSRYRDGARDCRKFRAVFEEAKRSVRQTPVSATFDLSSMFLAIRNIASCYLLHVHGEFNFSRHAALGLGELSVPICQESFAILERARLLSTRGRGAPIRAEECTKLLGDLDSIQAWMDRLVTEAIEHE